MTETLHFLVLFLVFALASWRISSILTREDGPMDIFENMRLKLSVMSQDEKYGSFRVAIDSLSRGVECMWCNSVWISAVFAIFLSTSFWAWIPNTLSLSTMVIAIEVLIKGRSNYG